jgi:hypothetical protein
MKLNNELAQSKQAEEAANMRRLWCHVINVLLSDARRDDTDGRHARSWLRHPDPLVLELAGLEPAAARPVLRVIADDAEAALQAAQQPAVVKLAA